MKKYTCKNCSEQGFSSRCRTCKDYSNWFDSSIKNTPLEIRVNSMDEYLKYLRGMRCFITDKYIISKSKRINDFFKEANLDSAVIGLSGGVDSAVVLALLLEAKKSVGSPIKKILPLIVPIHGLGVSGQHSAQERAINLCEKFGIEYQIFDLSHAYANIVNIANKSTETNSWADGQMASVLRTPVFYYQAAILQMQGFKSIVVGTTNRDEGSYIGFFGKASDGMVDLQPIADIHKSEVYKVAKYLGVTDEIINEPPTGDVWDGRTDHELIGAPYDAIELFILNRDYTTPTEKIVFKDNLEGEKFKQYTKTIEMHHAKNYHKYQVGSPAHFIDEYKRKVNGGW